MSLISDALRKARQEASRSAGEGTGLPRPLQPPPYHRRPSPGAVILVAAVAAVLGAGSVWIAVHRNTRSPEPVARADRAAPVSESPAGALKRGPAVPAGPTAGPGGETPERREGGSVVPSPPMAGPGTGSSGAKEAGTVPDDGDRTAPSVSAAVPSPASQVVGGGRLSGTWRGRAGVAVESDSRRARVPAAGRGTEKTGKEGGGRGTAGPREIVGEGTVDGVKLTLDYLVYRSKDPFAQINGVEVHVGTEVDGFTILAIGEDRIRLQGAGGPVILRVH